MWFLVVSCTSSPSITALEICGVRLQRFLNHKLIMTKQNCSRKTPHPQLFWERHLEHNIKQHENSMWVFLESYCFFFFATTWIIFDKVVVPILRIIQLGKHIPTFNHIQCFHRRPTPFLYNCEKKLWKQTDRKPTLIMLTEHHKERKICVYNM